jgi:CxxC motif-containing protein (DUF1111 family)
MKPFVVRTTTRSDYAAGVGLLLIWAMPIYAQVDPGPRAGAAGAGGVIAGVTVKEQKFFSAGAVAFAEIGDVTGSITGDSGLGPTFNLDSCAGCHAQPAMGGSSPSSNPQLARKNVSGAYNPTEYLDNILDPAGPVREMRLLSLGGGVLGLFSIKGRVDAPGCTLNPPDLRTIPASDRRFRIPTPTFGLGLIEAISDATIAANEAAAKPYGIAGHANRTGNDGTITRFGWKAQNKSLVIFAGEAYNVEQGVSNEVFPDERRPAGSAPTCTFNATPEDHTNFDETNPTKVSSDVIKFSNFMRLLAAPAPVPSGSGYTTTLGNPVSAASIANGKIAFNTAGCNVCHMPSLPTGNHYSAALANTTAALYSDLLVHDVGTGDGISQGAAGPNEFRTAPLWGVGQRLFFLHDGRAANLVDAIAAHHGEAAQPSGVIFRFNSLLTATDRQDLINFLRSL